LMDGLDATRCIRSLEGGRDVKIAGVSASVFASEREEMLGAGLNDFVRKPYSQYEVFDCMARHIGVRYSYAAATAADGFRTIRPADLATLPPEMRADLESAVVSLDSTRIAGAIELITEKDPALATGLRKLADRLEYSAIHSVLQKSKRV